MPKLSNNERAPFTDIHRFNYLDLQRTGYLSTIGAANQRIIGSVPAGGAVNVCCFYQITDPAGATDITADVGVTAADPDDFIDNLDVDALVQAAYNTGDVLTTAGDDGTLYINNSASPVNILMEINWTISSLTAGEWIIGFNVFDPGRFSI